jgi:hypothetical protein
MRAARSPRPLDRPAIARSTKRRLDLVDLQAERLSGGLERARGVLVEPLQEARVIGGEFCVRLGAVYVPWR